MNNKNKIILQDSGSVIIDSALIVADQIVSSIPLLSTAWNLSKALYGAGLKLRQQRALEWVEMIRDNPAIFTDKILADENFQDGFVYMLENYLRERSTKKRSVAKNIFLGFVQAEDKNSFSIEKFNHTLNQLSEKDISIIGDIDVKSATTYFFDDPVIAPDIKILPVLNYQIYGNNTKNRENIYNLINLGILLHETGGSRLGPVNAPFVSLSIFGREFIKFINQE